MLLYTYFQYLGNLEIGGATHVDKELAIVELL